MLHEDNRYRIRVEKPVLQMASNGACHYQFDIGSWIVFDTLSEAKEFIQDRLQVDEPGKAKKTNGEQR